VITNVAVSNITYTAATVSWSTDEAADAQVDYGLTAGYGSQTVVSPALVTAHSVVVSGLSPATQYHFQVKSRDGSANLAVLGDFTFTTATVPPGPAPSLLIAGETGELSGTGNNAVLTPAVGPAGVLKVSGSGSVNFASGVVGSGVYFQNQSVSNKAYYQFSGTALGSVFDGQAGEVEFYLKSQHSYAQRQASSLRTVFAVQDVPGSYPFYFILFANRVQYRAGTMGAAGNTYFFPAGQEDVLLGSGVVLKVKVAWDGTTMRLYLNDVLTQSAAYSRVALNWSSSSLMTFGVDDPTGYAINDDVTDEFVVRALSAAPDTTAPAVTVTAPVEAATVVGGVTLTATASDAVGVAGVQFRVDGNAVGAEDTSAPYTVVWDSTLVGNGSHQVTALARDAAGNLGTSLGVNLTVNNPVDQTPPVRSAGAPSGVLPGNTTAATLTLSTNENAVCRWDP